MSVEKRFFASRDERVEYVKHIGQFILDNAEDIVGNYHCVISYDIVGHVDMESIPTVEVRRNHVVADWNNRRQTWHDRDRDSEKDCGAASGDSKMLPKDKDCEIRKDRTKGIKVISVKREV